MPMVFTAGPSTAAYVAVAPDVSYDPLLSRSQDTVMGSPSGSLEPAELTVMEVPSAVAYGPVVATVGGRLGDSTSNELLTPAVNPADDAVTVYPVAGTAKETPRKEA